MTAPLRCDVGEALVRLKRREVVLALGCKTFAELCEKHVAISASQAERLIDIAENMTREAAIELGSTLAASLVALARATPATTPRRSCSRTESA